MFKLFFDYKFLYVKLLGLNLFKFSAISGPYGKGEIPEGNYDVEDLIRIKDDESNNAYKKDGFPWWSPIEPNFKTIRNGLGIHPDGNKKGTLGCIGINKDDMLLYYVIHSGLKVCLTMAMSGILFPSFHR